MRRTTAAEDDFRREISGKMTDYIRRHYDGSQAKAAAGLKISRQRLHSYLKVKMTPKTQFLHQVCTEWGLEFSYHGINFSADAFKLPQRGAAPSEQMGLFDIPQVLGNEQWEVEVHRKSANRFDLSIRVRAAS